MFKLAIGGAVAVSGVWGAEPKEYVDYDFEAFLKEHGKVYSSETEYEQRKQLFEKSLLEVKAHNVDYKSGRHTWWAAMNDLADWTPEEYRILNNAKSSPLPHPMVSLESVHKEATRNPESIDWREKGAVTPVKNQGQCGSCWTFASTETVESRYFVASGKLVVLSPQTYVNCVKNPNQCGGTGGCEGGIPELAFNFTRDMGIALESDIPYLGKDAPCKSFKAAVKVSGYVKMPVNSAVGLETALASGPVSVNVAAMSWQMYGGGIFHGCSSPGGDNTVDHVVQAVGYSKDYWIIRNSWGPKWGEEGYMRLSRASDQKTFVDSKPADGVACKPFPSQQAVGGECGILLDVSYPTDVHAATSDIVV